MAGPITLKAGSYPAAADGFEGFRELTSAEIQNQIAGIITQKFATDTTGSGTAELNIVTGGSAGADEIGTFNNTERTEPVGTHPASGGTSLTVYRFNQPSSTASTSGQTNPCRWNGDEVEVSADGEVDSEILDYVISAMANEDANTVGQYKLDTSTPAGGTWTSRYSITETQVDGTDVTYNLYQKTSPTTSAGTDSNMPVISDGDGDLREATTAEVQSLTGAFRNRIMSSGVGTYLLQTGTPSAPGTWQQMGGTMTDQLKNLATYAYAGNYTGSYVGSYDRFFAGFLNGSYAGTYSGTYTGYYNGLTVITTSSTQETKQLFIRTA